MSKQDSIVVGIDVAKDSLDVALPGAACTVTNSPTGIKTLKKKLPKPGDAIIVLEATGGYENIVVAELLADGHHIARVNPRQVRRFAEALGILAKTEKIDAQVIAKFGQHIPVRQLTAISRPRLELGQVVIRRRQLVELKTMESNRKQQSTEKRTLKSIKKMIKTLEQQIVDIDKEIARANRVGQASSLS